MKTRRNNKRPRIRGRRTRSKRQRGSGASCSRPTENIDIDMTDEQIALNDALGTAIVRKDPSRVKQLLDEGAHATITIDDDHGRQHGLPVETIPAIMYVARHVKDPNTIILNHLLNADSNLNVQGGCAVSRMGTTLLSEAAEWMNIDMMRELLNLEADINDASHRPPALSYAVLNEDLDMINFILSDREGQINLGYTHDDVRHNVIDEALELYENIESETERERIHEIVETLKRYAVKQSIMSVDDFNTKCEKNQESGKPECGILMNELTNKTAVMPHPPMPNTDGSSEANTSVCFDRSALQQHLLNRMENPNVRPPILTNPITGREISEQDIERMFPLGLDAHYTHKSYTKYDVQNGGKSKRKTRRNNKRPRKHGRKTRSKRQSGGDVEEYYELIIASRDGDIDRVAMLLEKGADVNAKDNEGWTALIWASANERTEIVRELLKNGADVNAKSYIGISALHQASLNGHTEIVKILLDKGAEVNARTNDGSTALIWASERGHTDIVELLEKVIKTEKETRSKKQKAMELVINRVSKVPSLQTLAHRNIDTHATNLYNKAVMDGAVPPLGSKLGGKRKTRKSKKSNKRFRTSRKKK